MNNNQYNSKLTWKKHKKIHLSLFKGGKYAEHLAITNVSQNNRFIIIFVM